MKWIIPSEISFCLLFFLCSFSNHNTHFPTQNEANTTPELKAVFVNGDSLHYIEMGKGDPVVFVHGALGDYRTWQGQMETFAKNHRVISYSRRFAYPNNQTVKDSAYYSISQHASDLAEFLKALNLGPAHLVGHSFGGAIVLRTTLDHPDLVRSLSLAEPAVLSLLYDFPGGDTLLKNFVVNSLIPATQAFINNKNEEAVKIFITGVMGDSTYFHKLPKKDHEIMMDNWPEMKGISMNKILPTIACDSLGKIKAPVLLIEGDRSPLFSTAVIKVLDHCLVNREDATLHNSSHGLENDNPTEFNKIVLGFINKN